MKRPLGNLTLAIGLALGGIGMARAQAQSPIDELQPLVQAAAARLSIAEQVALAKWDSGKPVEDSPREAEVIAAAVEAGKLKGLDAATVAGFFKAQIEANKAVQYSLLADWRRRGKAPVHEPVDLVHTIRPELDRLQTALIENLAKTTAIRASIGCPTNIAKAAGKYLAAHEQDVGHLPALALDRSLAATCDR